MGKRTAAIWLGALAGLLLGILGDSIATGILLAAFGGFLVHIVSRPRTARRPPPAPSQAPEDPFAFTERFLDEALEDGLLDPPTHARLFAELTRRAAPGPETAEASLAPADAPQAPAPPAPLEPRRPGPWTIALRRAWQRALSDFAVHGLAYFGVLLVFVGTLGFVLFAFSGVTVVLRPVAELVIPVVFFGSARFLRGKGAPLVSASLELLGGAVTPVVLFTSLVDGAPLPPDLEGGALVGALTAVSVGLAIIYGGVARRRSGSPLRFLVAPAAWTALGALGLGLEGEVSVAQMALVGWGIAATVTAARLRSDHRLAGPTRLAAAPSMLVVVPFGFALASGSGFPPVPLLLLGSAGVLGLELVGWAGLRPTTLLVAGVGAALLGPGWGTGWAGVAGAIGLVGLAERWGRDAESGWTADLALAGAGAALLAALAEPAPRLAGWGVVGAWAHVRRVRVLPGVPVSPLTWAAAVLPVGAAWGVVELVPGTAGWAILGVVLAGLSESVRRVRPDDGLYGWWIPSAAAMVALGTTLPGVPVWAAVGAGGATLAMAAGLRRPAVRVWGSSPPAVWAGVVAAEAAGVPEAWIPSVVGLGALAGVTAGLVPLPGSGHLMAVGHLAGLGALLASPPGGPRTLALGAWTAGWLLAVAGQELGRDGLGGILERWAPGRVAWRVMARSAPAAGLVVAGPFLVAALGELVGLTGGSRGRTGILLALLALAYGGAARGTSRRRPLGPMMAIGAVAVSGIAIAVAAPEPWPTIWALALSIGVVAVMGGAVRRPFMTWFAWAMSAVLALLLADRAGIRPEDLHRVLLVWGGGLLVGGLAVDDFRSGRRPAGGGLREAWLLPPVALAALAVPTALAFAFSQEPSEYWGWALGAAGLYGGVALQLRAGSVTAASYALVVFGLGARLADTPWSPLARPWELVVAAGLLVGVAWALGRRREGSDLWLSWWPAPLVVAHGAGAVALARTAVVGSVPATWAGLGAVSLVVAVWLGRWPWAAAGAVLVLVGAEAAGPGWLALALAGTAAASGVAATRSRDVARLVLQVVTVGATGWAWTEGAVWAGWTLGAWATATSLAAGAVAVGAAAVHRRSRLPRDWTLAWGGLATVALGTVVAVIPQVDPWPSGVGLAVGLALAAVAAGLGAGPLGWGFLRETAAVVALGSGAALGYGLGSPLDVRVAGAVVAGMAASLGALGLDQRSPGSPWMRPLLLYAALANLGALVLAGSAWPRRSLLVAVLLASGLEAAVVGIVGRRPFPLYVAPGLLAAGWVLFAQEALSPNPQWFTVPTGATLLAVVEVARWDPRRDLGGSEPLVAVEYLGMALVVGAALIQTVVASVAYGLSAIILGLAVAGWATLTRVRRRLYVGSGSVLAAAVLMVAIPLARILPEFRGPALWAALAALGAALIVAATSLEQGRARLAATAARLEEVLEGWE